MSLLEWLDRLSPRLCRLIARKASPCRQHCLPLSNEELSNATGMSVRRIERLSVRDTWAGVPANEVSLFREACGVTMATESAQMKYLKKTLLKSKRPLHHTRKLGKKMLRALIR